MKLLPSIICSLCFAGLSAQVDLDRQLAKEFFDKQEYEKAAVLYEKLLEREPEALDLYRYYLATLLALEDFTKAEKLVRKKIKSNPGGLHYKVELGYVLAQKGADNKAAAEYEEAIGMLPPDKSVILQLAGAFISIQEQDLAIKTYEAGRKLLGDPLEFTFELANIYSVKGDMVKTISLYLDYLEQRPAEAQYIQNVLQNSLAKKEFALELQAQLYRKLQKLPDDINFHELLVWQFMQTGDFRNALIQVKALDKRFREKGRRVLDLARLAHAGSDYDLAIEAYEYVVQQGSLFELTANMELLNCRKDKVVSPGDFTPQQLVFLENEYEKLLGKYGRTLSTVQLMKEYADLEAKYIHNYSNAISILTGVLKINGLPRNLKGEAKLTLGDYFLMSGDEWEATLYYSQVDKEFKDDPQGEEARFRNARLSYFNGDFEWAQAQLEVLQASTSELISNDAIDLFVFIQDHFALDTVVAPMLLYAEADLLYFQNKLDRAYEVWDTLKLLFPGHALTDDVLFAQSDILGRKRDYSGASRMLEEILSSYGDGVVADDALFALAELNETRFANPERAKELYQKLIIEYSGSTWVIEARKRFRRLRGDQVN